MPKVIEEIGRLTLSGIDWADLSARYELPTEQLKAMFENWINIRTDDEVLRQIVKQKHFDNRSWRQIGESLGLKKEATRMRYRAWREGLIGKDGAGQIKADFHSMTDDKPIISGLMPDDDQWKTPEYYDDLIDKLIKNQEKSLDVRMRARREQSITLHPPCLFVPTSDWHLGDPGTDYKAVDHDMRLIADTPGVYTGFNGDGINNWVIGKLAKLQHGETISYDDEWGLFFHYMEMLKGKLLFVLTGNHDNWTKKVSFLFDPMREALKGVRVLYDTEQINFRLNVGPKTYKVQSRHKWKYSSIFNPTHPIEVGWQRGDFDYDIGIGSHTHIGTYCRPFHRHQIRRWAILTGAYKLDDKFAREMGYPTVADRGCGALLFSEDGKFVFYEDLEYAIDVLGFLRKKVI